MEQVIMFSLEMAGMLVYVVQGYFFYRSIGFFVERREHVLFRLAGWVLATHVAGIIIFANDFFNVTFAAPLFLLLLLVCYRGKLIVKVSVILLFFPIVIGLNFLYMELAGFVILHYTSASDEMNVFICDVFMLAVCIFWLGFLKQMERRDTGVVNLLDSRSWLLMDVICLASLAAVISNVYFAPVETYKVWLGMLACVVTNLGCIDLTFYLAKSIRSELEKRNLKLQKDYYQELEANQLAIRSFRHDINNHFSVAAELLEAGKAEEAKEYLNRLSGQMTARGRNFCKNSIVNAVLNAKYNQAAAGGIDCFFHIEIEKLLFINPIDLCTVFSNTLDNAIEACNQIEHAADRKLSVKARCLEAGYFSYEIRNTKRNEIRIEKGKYRTGKEDKKLHGIGLENVREAVNRYHGTMDISYTDTEFCIVIIIAEKHSLN